MAVREQRELADANRRKYLKAPTISEIENFIKELKINAAQFERFFGIPDNTIPQIKNGYKRLPARFWHIIYEKIIPAYSTEGKKQIKTGHLPNLIPETLPKSQIKAPEEEIEDPKLKELIF